MIIVEELIIEDTSLIKNTSTVNDNFWKWFGDSKVINSKGAPLKVYHGTKRPDRIGSKFDPKRATSGPMAFFTDNPEIAGNYAKGKRDTSIVAPDTYAGWFKFKPKGSRKEVTLDQAWYYLPYSQKQELAQKLPHIIEVDSRSGDNRFIFTEDDYGPTSKEGWEYAIKVHRGNVLAAAIDLWLDSAALFNEEEEFLKILALIGITNVEYDPPTKELPGIYPVYLSIQNPLYTNDIPEDLIQKLFLAGKRKRARPDLAPDAWGKTSRSGKEWLDLFKDDLEKGTAYVWTSIPDWVTAVLKEEGYDGIIDEGGKYSSNKHKVFIPFTPHQIKSIYNKGTWNPNSAKIEEQK